MKAVRGINGRYSATELHDVLNIDWLDVALKKSTCIELYKLLNDIGPANLTSEFEERPCQRVLRNNNVRKVMVKMNKTKLADNDFVTRSVKYWSLLPPDIQEVDNVAGFRNAVKKCDYFEHVP